MNDTLIVTMGGHTLIVTVLPSYRNQLTGFYMRATQAFNRLTPVFFDYCVKDSYPLAKFESSANDQQYNK